MTSDESEDAVDGEGGRNEDENHGELVGEPSHVQMTTKNVKLTLFFRPTHRLRYY